MCQRVTQKFHIAERCSNATIPIKQYIVWILQQQIHKFWKTKHLQQKTYGLFLSKAMY